MTGVGEAPAYGWVPPGVWNYTPQQFDYARHALRASASREARQLYAAAGYSAAKPLRSRAPLQHRRRAQPDRGRDRLDVEGNARRRDHALCGGVPRAAADYPGAQETQVFRSSWVGDYNDAYSFAQLLQSDFGINLTGYSNPRYDALLAEAVTQSDTSNAAASCSRRPSG